MISKFIAALIAATLIFSNHFTIAQAAPPPVEAFAQSPNLADAIISGDGQYFFVRTANGAHRTFSVVELGEKPQILLQADENEDFFIEFASWVNNDTLLLRFSRQFGPTVKLGTDGSSESYKTRFGSSLYIFNASNGPPKSDEPPFKQISAYGRHIHDLPSDPDHIIIESGSRNLATPDVFKVNLRTGKQQLLQRHRPNIYSWTTDRHGEVRLGWGAKRGRWGSQKLEYIFLAKLAGENGFKDLSDRFEDIDDRFEPLDFAQDPNQIYVLSNHETDTMALYLFDLKTEAFVEQLYHDPEFDIDQVVVNISSGELEGLSVGGDVYKFVWIDPAAKREIGGLRNTFVGKEAIWRSYKGDSDFAIVYVYSPTFAGQLYIYDRTKKELSPLPPQYPGLESEKLGASIATSYPARDGVSIPAFVTLPPGNLTLENTKNIPLVVLPHGGPAARDYKIFDLWAQFLATRGYGVLQMNFRGSAGYGLKYEKTGRRQWGRLMQDDVIDGVNWLVEQGTADAERVAILGASYGGYAALMAAVLTPEKFQCAVSFAGVTNLFGIITDDNDDSYFVRAIGDRFENNDDLRAYSPLLRSDEFEIPVMIIHGRLDSIVPYEQGEDLYKRLSSKGHPVEFLGLPKSGHNLDDYDDRQVFYRELEKYLGNCLN